MSAAARSSTRVSSGRGSTPNASASAAARSSDRLTTETSPTPADLRALTARRPIFPAPTTVTRLPESVPWEPNARRASSTAADDTETGLRAISVSVLDRLPARSARRNALPRILNAVPSSVAIWNERRT